MSFCRDSPHAVSLWLQDVAAYVIVDPVLTILWYDLCMWIMDSESNLRECKGDGGQNCHAIFPIQSRSILMLIADQCDLAVCLQLL